MFACGFCVFHAFECGSHHHSTAHDDEQERSLQGIALSESETGDVVGVFFRAVCGRITTASLF